MATGNGTPTGNGFQDLKHQTFEKLFVERYDGKVDGKKDHWWHCTCKCGNTKRAKGTMLRHRQTRSCGCLYQETRGVAQRTHGLSGTPEYVIWCGMKGRCRDAGNSLWHKYGAKGIMVCDRLYESFEAFMEVMGPRPTPGHLIDREESTLHYSCGDCSDCKSRGWTRNVRWVTGEESAENRSNVKKYTLGDESMSLAKWARKVGMKYITLRNRIYRDGKSFEEAILTDGNGNPTNIKG